MNTAKHKVAILDLGSNTSKLLVANRSEGKKVEAIFQKSLPCRILLDKNDHLSEPGLDRIIKTVSKLHFEAVKFKFAISFSKDLYVIFVIPTSLASLSCAYVAVGPKLIPFKITSSLPTVFKLV